jgi:hypothetical protein
MSVSVICYFDDFNRPIMWEGKVSKNGVGVFGIYLENCKQKQSMLQHIHFRKVLEKIFPEMYGL